MIPVEGHKNLYRDEESGAIINFDDYEYNLYISRKNQARHQKEEIDNLKNDVNELKQKLNIIIDMLNHK